MDPTLDGCPSTQGKLPTSASLQYVGWIGRPLSQAVAEARHAARWSRCAESTQFGCASAPASAGCVRTAHTTPAISNATPTSVSSCGQLLRSTNA